jgi:alpha-D-ribose 1-methylphosphonate 5-triphosphate diphosphatase
MERSRPAATDIRLIINADVAVTDRILKNHFICVENDRIARVAPMGPSLQAAFSDFTGAVIDAKGMLACAGFIDMHSDAIESIIQPRPTSIVDPKLALAEQEKMLVNQGITTMYHSLSFIGENGTLRDKEARKPHRMQEIAELIKGMNGRPRLIRHRFHCRFDVCNTDGYGKLLELLDRGSIHLLSFTDHRPGQGQYRDFSRYKTNLKNYRPEIEEKEMQELIVKRIATPCLSAELLESIAMIARKKGIPIASHDDDSPEKLDFVHDRLLADISEFPVELDIAREARKRGMLTVAGAPNVLSGKSHSGNMSALEAIQEGLIDILCSDYFPPALIHAAFKLHRDFGLPLWECLNMITINPARGLGLEKDYGSVEEGKKADILLLRLLDDRPAVVKAFVDGVLATELHYRMPASLFSTS